MIRKFLYALLLLCMMFAVTAAAENENDANGQQPTMSENMQAPPGGRRDRPGGNMPNGERPQMPDGNAPPQNDGTDRRPPAQNAEQGQTAENGQTAETVANGNSENMPSGRETNEMPSGNDNTDDRPQPPTENGETAENGGDDMRRGGPGMGGQPPQGDMPSDMNDVANNAETQSSSKFATFTKEYATPITSIVLLVLAFVFVVLYKRKSY